MARSLVIDKKIVQTKNCIPNGCYSAAFMRFPSAPPGLPSWFPRNLIARLPDDPLYSLSAQKKPSDNSVGDAQSDAVLLTIFFISELALKINVLCAGIDISAPVKGFRPLRSFLERTENFPKFFIFTVSPRSNEALITSKAASTTLTASVIEISFLLQIRPTISALVSAIFHPPHIKWRSKCSRAER